MANKILHRFTYFAFAAVIAFALLPVVKVGPFAGYGSDNKWAWSPIFGWLKLDDPNGNVTACSDHLEGHVWAENIGWIKLGSAGGGGTPYYANTTKDNYGVNRDSAGNLSGYA